MRISLLCKVLLHIPVKLFPINIFREAESKWDIITSTLWGSDMLIIKHFLQPKCVFLAICNTSFPI